VEIKKNFTHMNKYSAKSRQVITKPFLMPFILVGLLFPLWGFANDITNPLVAAFAETLGSIAGGMQIDLNDKGVVGIELSCNHLRSVKNGWVYGKAAPIKIGRKIHVWNIEIKNEDDNLVCVSRLTLAVISKK
jgi:hypothetical protein